MPEAVLLLVLAGGVVGMRQARHENDTHVLAQRLHRNGNARRGAARDHDRAVALDHARRRGARRVTLGLRVAGDVLHLLAQDAVALQRGPLEGVEHAAIALAVNMLHSELVGLELVLAFFGIGAGLRTVEAEHDL